MYIFRPPRLRLHRRLRRHLNAVGEERVLTKPNVLHKGYFLYLCWGEVTLDTSAVWKQNLFFFVNGMQFFVCLFVLFIKSQGKTDVVISSLIKGQTEI